MVEMTGLEPAASCSQSTRATSCATSRYFINLVDLVIKTRFVRPLASHSRLALRIIRSQHSLLGLLHFVKISRCDIFTHSPKARALPAAPHLVAVDLFSKHHLLYQINGALSRIKIYILLIFSPSFGGDCFW